MPLCKSLSNIFLSILHKPQPLKTCLSFFSRNNNSKSCLLQLKPLRNFIKSLTKTAQLFLKMTLMLNQMICFSQGDMFSSWFSSSFVYQSFFIATERKGGGNQHSVVCLRGISFLIFFFPGISQGVCWGSFRLQRPFVLLF